MKPVVFLGSSQDDIRAMPAAVRHALGVELMRVQFGAEPTDFKAMPGVGAGCFEVRVRDASGTFRAIYVAKFVDAVYVLHAFQKKSARTRKDDIELAARRYRMIGGRR